MAALAAAFTLVKALFGYAGLAAVCVGDVRWLWLRAGAGPLWRERSRPRGGSAHAFSAERRTTPRAARLSSATSDNTVADRSMDWMPPGNARHLK